ncbi:hypothetical protein D9613_008716 [Agrocybe pediades]|uniref:NUDIX hydrolase n=1 Tax=Agrocybe pediades TaxID=84607 RepID=A0A8H4QUD0_9AGAR|nr:hypothetical protein D9613_008716 [Agrocybe pediades]
MPSLLIHDTMQDIPPGIPNNENLEYFASGGDDKSWLSFDKIKQYTNAFIVQDGKVLLGYKKRGFGQGKYNGFGGKVDAGESSLQAAIRELQVPRFTSHILNKLHLTFRLQQEEAGIIAPLEHAGSLLFISQGSEWAFQIEIYRAETFEGTITESDEMRPEWFSINALPGKEEELLPIPFSKMWDTDEIWLPLLFEKKGFVGRADFTQDGEIFKPYKWWYGSLTS